MDTAPDLPQIWHQMSCLPHIVLRIFAGIAGALLFYVAFFLYEDEERRLQNRLEEIWKRIDALQSHAMSKEVAFVKEATRITSAVLDRLFGERLMSLQFVAVSAVYSFGSFLIFQVVWNSVFLGKHLLESDSRFMMAEAFVLFVLASLPALTAWKSPRALKWYYRGLVILLVCLSVLWDFELPPAGTVTVEEILTVDVLILPVGILCDILCVLFFRWILRRMARLSSIWIISGCLTGAIVATLLLVGPAIYSMVGHGWGGRIYEPSLALLPQMSATNLVTAACLLLFITVMALLLAHRLVWPSIKRPLYAANRKGLIQNTKLLGVLGTGFLMYAFPNNPLVKWLTEFLPKVKD